MNNGDSVSTDAGAKREAGDDANPPATKRPQLVNLPVHTPSMENVHEQASERAFRGHSLRPSIPGDPLPPQIGAFHRPTSSSEPIARGKRGADDWTSDVELPIAKIRMLERDNDSMKGYIAKLESAVKRKTGDHAHVETPLHDQLAKLKIQLRDQDEANNAEVGWLRRRNKDLEDDKSLLELEVKSQNVKIQRLETDISDLSLDLRERETLYRESLQAEQKDQDQNSDIDDITRKYKKWKKSARLNEKRVDKLEEQLGLERQLTEYLQTQKKELEKEYQERGSKIIELMRDLDSDKALKKVNKAVKESKRILLARLEGMYAHYRTLHGNNEALVAKLTAMATAGGFGHHSSKYRKELDALKGEPLEDLNEYEESS
jgi:predicted  nucleic acid-binding Zn-ribbon protein